MNISEIKSRLMNFSLGKYEKEDIAKSLSMLKSEFVSKGLEKESKEVWCLESILKIQTEYLNAFNFLKIKEYYKAWCVFEQIELALKFLSPHFNIKNNAYMLEFIDVKVRQYQKLYPYKLFFSPEILEHEKECNICGKIINIRNSCGHEVGEIYKGELCCRNVTKMEFLGISLVESPLQKYSVAFPVDEGEKHVDNYNYSLISYLVERLENPLDDWSFEVKKKKYSHSHFFNIGKKEKCPCQSGKEYGECCLNKDGVELPHYEFIFSKEIPDELQYEVLSI